MSEQCEVCGKMRNSGLVHECQSILPERGNATKSDYRELPSYVASKTTFNYLRGMSFSDLKIRMKNVSRLIDDKNQELEEISRFMDCHERD